MQQFTITFYGVRGSSAAKLPGQGRYGGNTSCALVRAGKSFIILDMGTGCEVLARDIPALGISRAAVLLSHYHYDHIEGFPHFGGFYSKLDVDIYGEAKGDRGVRELLYGYMSAPYYPITPANFSAELRYHTIQSGQSFAHGEVQVTTRSAYHPDGSLVYKLCYGDKTLVYMLDHELGSAADEQLAEFCKNADLLVMDAHFTHEEYSTGSYKGWGHSSQLGCLEFAKAANARALALNHHAIQRKDSELDELSLAMQSERIKVVVAREGMELTI